MTSHVPPGRVLLRANHIFHSSVPARLGGAADRGVAAAPRRGSGELVDQRLGVDQIRRFETFAENSVDRL